MHDQMLPPRAGSAVPHLGTYVREMAVSVERMYENALDWEHLPFLHASSFARIELLAREPDAWRARAWSARPGAAPSLIELRLDRTCRRWITRTLEGPNAGHEIWTHCIPLDEGGSARRLMVVVDFHGPGVPPEARARVGAAYQALYRQLYDEDERMMLARQAALDARAAAAVRTLALGPVAELEPRLPLDVAVGGRRLRVRRVGGELIAHALDCPHMLAPLDAAPVEDGCVTCPWHGYRFALHDGQQVNAAIDPQATPCRLHVRPVRVDAQGQAHLE